MTDYGRGGVIRSADGKASVPMVLDPDECVLAPRTLKCQRLDKAHNCEPHEVRTWDGAVVATRWGPCRHRHPEPVESVVTGEVVAYLCPACDAQLPG